jgi:hypothetical protein
MKLTLGDLLFILDVLIIIGCVYNFTLINSLYSEMNRPMPQASIESSNQSLYNILYSEYKITKSINTTNWNCLSYSTYYNTTLSERYKDLDIRWLNYVDICDYKNNPSCNMTHSFLVVSGHCQECILDQMIIKCVDLKCTNEQKK